MVYLLITGAELISEYESLKRDIAVGKDEKKKPVPPAVQKTPTPARKAKLITGEYSFYCFKMLLDRYLVFKELSLSGGIYIGARF